MKLVRSQLEELNKTLARKTEQAKAASQEHQAAEAELRIAATAFESQECMMITDANRAMLRVNRAFTEITGYQPDEAIGQSPSILKSGRHDAAFFGAMEESLRRTGGWQGEIWNMRKNGEVFPVWLTIAVVRSKEGDITHYVGALTDMTMRKNAEEKILHLALR